MFHLRFTQTFWRLRSFYKLLPKLLELAGHLCERTQIDFVFLLRRLQFMHRFNERSAQLAQSSFMLCTVEDIENLLRFAAMHSLNLLNLRYISFVCAGHTFNRHIEPFNRTRRIHSGAFI